MRQDQRERVHLGRAHVDKVDVLIVNRGSELRELIQLGFVLTPVVAGSPIPNHVLHILEADTIVPANAGQLVGPAGAAQPASQVIQVGLGNVDAERSYTGVGIGCHIMPPTIALTQKKKKKKKK